VPQLPLYQLAQLTDMETAPGRGDTGYWGVAKGSRGRTKSTYVSPTADADWEPDRRSTSPGNDRALPIAFGEMGKHMRI